MKKGLLIILSGPSGVGKGTIRKYIMKRDVVPLVFSISMTTRKPRESETNGVEYFFVSKQQFQQNIDENNFLEWAEFVGNYYGTPRKYVEDLRDQGINVILEIEITGAEQVLKNVKDDRVISFFLSPPSLRQLELRIRKRKSETEEVIQKRLEKGKKEMALASNYDFVVLNDSIKRAGDEIISIIQRFDED